MVKKIAIIGGGVVGLSCGVKIAEYVKNNDKIDVCLLSEKFSPNTTGDGSAGLWGPYLIGDNAPDKINKWSAETHELFHELWKSGKAAELGISLQPVTRLTCNASEFNPCWNRIVFGYSPLSYDQLDRWSLEHSTKYTAGDSYVTFTCEPSYLLPYLKRRFESAGGKVFQRRVDSFADLIQDYDLIINCTGLGAKILANDQKLKPIRGQVARVEASWNFQSIETDENYIITNMDTVILGGTAQVDDYNENVSEVDSKFIRQGCLNMVPSLINSTTRREWVGLRPGREVIRIEEEIYEKKNGKSSKIIHNYGHGGSGVTTAWGCATEVLDLVKENLNGISRLKSKM